MKPVGIRLTCNPDTDLVAYLTDDQKGKRYIFRMSLRLNTKKLKMVITTAHIKSYLFRLLLPVKKELSLFPTIKLVTSSNQKDLVHEYRTKFRHTENAVSRPMPKFEG